MQSYLLRLLYLLLVICKICSATWPMVGWDAYQNWALATFRFGEVTRQFSSFDRANKNDDGFNGTYSCLRLDTDGRCIIAEHEGPGEIASIWFTYEPDSVSNISDIRIELDSGVVLDAILQEIVNSETGEPFVWPLVGNTNDTNGGNVIKVPMPYHSSMTVTTRNNPHFYHVVYREFPLGTEVATFDASENVTDLVEVLEKFGVRDPKLQGENIAKNIPGHKDLNIEPSGSTSLSLSDVAGTVLQLQLRIPEILGGANVYDDGRAFGSGGSSQFRLSLDEANDKCYLTRRVDLSIGSQIVRVSIDGQKAGKLSTGESQDATFYDQVLHIDPSLTNGKSSIDVQLDFVGSDLDANEFMYSLHCTTQANSSWQLPAYGSSSNWTLMDILNVGPNNPHDEAAHSYVIQNQTWAGLRNYSYADDRLIQQKRSTGLLNMLLLSMTFDGKETVNNVPLGAFFGTSLSKQLVRSLMISVDNLAPDGAFTSYFTMPFHHNATLTLNNTSPYAISATIDWLVSPYQTLEFQDDGQPPTYGYFHTYHHRGPTTPGAVWPVLSTTGPGVFYGLTHTFRGSILPPDNDLEFLEGDWQVYINRTTPPSNPINDISTIMLGTGTEDYYESGWYFNDINTGADAVGVPFAMPLTGLTNHLRQQHDLGCVGQCLTALRWMIADSLAFDKDGISVNIEHGPVGNNIEAEYETCAFYYV